MLRIHGDIGFEGKVWWISFGNEGVGVAKRVGGDGAQGSRKL